jgi:hypothetical protein
VKSLGPKIRTAYLRAMAAFAVIAVATACNSASRHQTSRPTLVPASALEGLLLSADEVGAVMGTNAMVADTPFVTARPTGSFQRKNNDYGGRSPAEGRR